MSTQRRINFGPADKTVDGKDVAEAMAHAIASSGPNFRGTDLKADVLSQRSNEKGILKQLCEAYAAKNKSLETVMEMSDMIEEINSSTDHVNYTKAEVDKLVKAFADIEITPPLLAYRGLLTQLKNFDKCEEVKEAA